MCVCVCVCVRAQLTVAMLTYRTLVGSSELQRSSHDVTSSGHAMTSYCSESIERYFRSLDESTVAMTTTPPAPTPAAAAIKQLFRARVAATTESLLQTANDNHVTSDDLDRCGDVSQGQEVSLRECEEGDERKRVAVRGLPDAIKSQLMIDVRDSLERTCHDDVTDSLTFEYLDDVPPVTRDCLPADLREEVRLDLHVREASDEWPRDHPARLTTQPAVNDTADHDDNNDDNSDDDVKDVAAIELPTDLSHHVDSYTPASQQQKATHGPARRIQSSVLYRKSAVPAGNDVLKPAPSKARPQTAVAATVQGTRPLKSSKKTVAWSRDSKPRHTPSAHVLDGRHICTASANHRSASSSADHW